mmetsp:Transcript_128663/g.345154  ORF Transcript_128663/g.345154 Transcript_128663/m.345154 type:complete len:414 (+) Transcript_128663:449-1690(+)
MGDLVVIIHHDIVDYLLGFLDVFALAGYRHHCSLRARPRRPRAFGHRDLHFESILDGPNDAALFADEIGQGIGGHLDGVALEVLVRQGSEALGNQLLESLLGLGHSFWLALDAQNVGLHIDCLHVGLLLDHVDGGTLGPDYDANPLLRDLQLGGGELFLGLLLGCRSALRGHDLRDLVRSGHQGLVHRRARLVPGHAWHQVCCRARTRHRLAARGLQHLGLQDLPLLQLLLLLRPLRVHARRHLPVAALAVVNEGVSEVVRLRWGRRRRRRLLILLLRLGLRLRRRLAVRLLLRVGLRLRLRGGLRRGGRGLRGGLRRSLRLALRLRLRHRWGGLGLRLRLRLRLRRRLRLLHLRLGGLRRLLGCRVPGLLRCPPLRALGHLGLLGGHGGNESCGPTWRPPHIKNTAFEPEPA